MAIYRKDAPPKPGPLGFIRGDGRWIQGTPEAHQELLKEIERRKYEAIKKVEQEKSRGRGR